MTSWMMVDVPLIISFPLFSPLCLWLIITAIRSFLVTYLDLFPLWEDTVRLAPTVDFTRTDRGTASENGEDGGGEKHHNGEWGDDGGWRLISSCASRFIGRELDGLGVFIISFFLCLSLSLEIRDTGAGFGHRKKGRMDDEGSGEEGGCAQPPRLEHRKNTTSLCGLDRGAPCYRDYE
ncbi:hypothetical protein N658DRAFT_63813 [Parathielavia hyrcaniae]|uniref:Uncharacterized protein n=1 Tax=Parathielavia hyrcaniae TaxID=113614 RepID=A0AAN6Q5S8_9PEZI|nr:hypothetical protein N658DRAFT_63813 [Parathielavia hyrcaniae]